jgi:hypothetical protein
MFWKAAVASWLVIVLAETLHGILRMAFLTPRLGDRRARQVGVFSGSVIILTIGWYLVPWIEPRSVKESLSAGALWVILMLAFELALGRLVLGYSWQRLTEDYNLCNGGFLGLGMMVLFLTPLITAKLRGLF